jgi:hypothetical protein
MIMLYIGRMSVLGQKVLGRVGEVAPNLTYTLYIRGLDKILSSGYTMG